MPELTVARLKELLHYDPETGAFTWITTNTNSVQTGELAGWVSDRGYRFIGIDGRLYRAHRLAWLCMNERWPSDGLDHKNGVKDDNRIQNLRQATDAVNGKNKKLQKNSTTKVCGVIFHKVTGKYLARIDVNHVCHYLGLFDDFEDAVAARKAAEVEYGFHPNHGKTAEERARSEE